MLLKDFKGLYTNHDTKDINPEFLKDSTNIKFKQGYLTTQFYALQSVQSDLTGEIVFIDMVYLDEDKLGVDANFESNYVPNIQGYQLIITKVEYTDYNRYLTYLLINNVWTLIPTGEGFNITLEYDLTKSDKDVFIFNKNGVVKIFLPHISLWLGKINRYYRGIINYSGFYLDALIEPYNTKEFLHGDIINGRLGIDSETEIITTGIVENEYATFNLISEGIYSVSRIAWKYFRKYNLKSAAGINIPNADGSDIFLFYSLSSDPNEPAFNDLIIPKSKVTSNNIYVFTPPDGYTWSEFTFEGTVYSQITIGATTGVWTASTGLTVEDNGFLISKPSGQIITTCILDDNAEFIVGLESFTAKFTSLGATKYAIKKTVYIPNNINRRITAFAFYIKFSGQTDFQQARLIRLQSKFPISFSTTYLSQLSLTGIYLTQTIGKLFNEYNHKLLEAFDDYIEITGVSYGLKGSQIYYPSIGNGQIQKDVFYNTSIIPELYNENAIALSNMNDFLGVHTAKGTKIVITKNSQYGSFLFYAKDSLGYSILKKQDVVSAYDGIAILTSKGIYITNGQNDFLLSEQINDVVEANYSSGMLLYDEYQKIFYLFFSNQDDFYLFDTKDKKWTKISLKTEGPLKKVYQALDAIYLQFDRGFYKLITRDTGSAIITTHKLNLGNPKTYKIFDGIALDFEGEIIYKGTTYEKKTRDIEIIPVPIKECIPAESKDFTFILKHNAKLYSINIEASEEALID